MSVASWFRNRLMRPVEIIGRLLGIPLPGRPTRSSATGPVPGAIVERLQLMQSEFEQANVRLGFIGESGSGKSSLINAIVGRPVAAVGALIETTQVAQEIPLDGLTLVDLPGCGTANWPRETYIERLGLLKDYDGFVLVTAQRLKQCDVMLYEELARKAKKPFFVVRSQFDQAVAAHEEQEARAVITPHIRRQLQADDLTVYMVASVGEVHFDLEKLILDIRAALPEWKQVRFIMAAHAYGEETLVQKRQAAEKIVAIHAGLAAANSLNPVPGLDVSVDVGILMTMSRHVVATYGFSEEQVEALKRQTTTLAAVLRGTQMLANRFAPYLTRKFVLAALGRMGWKAAARTTTKWVPVVGTLVAASLGYKLASAFGEQLIDECEAAARELLAS